VSVKIYILQSKAVKGLVLQLRKFGDAFCSMTIAKEKWYFEIKDLLQQSKAYTAEGACASYIPALHNADPSALGVYLISPTGAKAFFGDWNTQFTLQSVSKIINFLVACETRGIEKVLEKVDVEPTGDAFDSIIRLEAHKPGKPFNPMINAGALTVASMLPGQSYREKFDVFTDTMQRMIHKYITVNEEVYQSERSTAYRNKALAYYLKSLGYLDGNVEDALEVYFRECSIMVTTEVLAEIGLILACDGYNPLLHSQVIAKKSARIVKSLMVTCGMYNASGKFAAHVGIPAKSGVSGAILATVPSHFSIGSSGNPFIHGCGIGVYGPAIDSFGNSTGGVTFLSKLSDAWNLSVF
jgi:glutaminase